MFLSVTISTFQGLRSHMLIVFAYVINVLSVSSALKLRFDSLPVATQSVFIVLASFCCKSNLKRKRFIWFIVPGYQWGKWGQKLKLRFPQMTLGCVKLAAEAKTVINLTIFLQLHPWLYSVTYELVLPLFVF